MIRVAVVVLVLVAILAVSPACAQWTYKCSTSVWDLQQQQSPITLDSNTIYVSGTGVRLSNTASSGVASFVGIDAPWPTNNAVCSWNVDVPPGTGFRTEVRGVNGGSNTSWYEIRRHGTIPGGITVVKGTRSKGIDDDTFKWTSAWPRIEYRVTLYSNTVGVTPTLRLMSVCYADTNTTIPYSELAAPGVATSLAVPWRCQYDSTRDPDIICGPTSMSMAMAYNGCSLPTETVAAECQANDDNGIYGNWPCLAQGAAGHGFKSYYSRANNQQPVRDFIAQGVPVEIGMAYNQGDLTNSPPISTAGHLVLCVGVAADGDWICNDPAGRTTFWDHVNYDKSEIAWVWGTNNATIIPCIPNSVYWRFPYYTYKSTDPISTNKDGKMDLFAKGANGELYRYSQASINGSWVSWTSMGGTPASDPVAVTNRTGGNSVFARFTDGNLYYSSQNGSSGSWSSWTSLGGPVAGKPAVGKSPDGRLDVFCRMPDGTIQHRWEATTSGWQAWASLGGNVPADPVVALNWEGREEVFVRGGDNLLYHKWQVNDGSWSGWASLGGPIAGDAAIGRMNDGRIEVYCRFPDSTVQKTSQTGLLVGTSWTGWSSVGFSTDANIATARTPAFLQDAFYRDTTSTVYHSWQTSVDGSLASRESLGGTSVVAPIVGHNENGLQVVFMPRSDGRIWLRTETSGGGWTTTLPSGAALFPETTAPVIAFVAVGPLLAAAGDSVSVTATVTDNASVASVKANGVSLINTGGSSWAGTIPASSALGVHGVTVEAKDLSGNLATLSSPGYTTARVVALSNRAVSTPTQASPSSSYLFAVFGKVTVVNSGQFTVDDGSGKPVDVYAAGHGLTNGRFVRARGVLDTSNPSAPHIDSSAGFITLLN